MVLETVASLVGYFLNCVCWVSCLSRDVNIQVGFTATKHFLYYIVLYFGVVKPVLWLSALEMLPGSVLFTSASVP